MIKKIFSILAVLMVISTVYCTPSKAGAQEKLDEPMKDKNNPLILMKTSMGDMYVELYPQAAPETVANFIGLATGTKEYTDPKDGQKKKGPYFDGLIFHRVIPNFMIQGGDIIGTGTGGPGYRFPDEINAKALGLDKQIAGETPYMDYDIKNSAKSMTFAKLNITSQDAFTKKQKQIDREFKKTVESLSKKTIEEVLALSGYSFRDDLPSEKAVKYSIAMANSGPNTNGSQFFINVNDTPHLNGKHTVFGKVVKGQDVAVKISEVPRGENDKPENNVILKKVIVLKD